VNVAALIEHGWSHCDWRSTGHRDNFHRLWHERNPVSADASSNARPVEVPRTRYARHLRTLLPEGAFQRSPAKLVHLVANSLIWAACIVLIARSSSTWVSGLCVLLGGACFAAIVLQAHHLSHETMVGRGAILSCIEMYAWGLAFFPRTIWRKLHNGLHHARVATRTDPDRRFTLAERTPTTRLYSLIFYPSRDASRFNPLIRIGVIYFAYLSAHIGYAFFGHWTGKPSTLAAVPTYSSRDRAAIALELLAASAVHVGLFALADWNAVNYALGVVMPALVASSIVMHYIFTQHALAMTTTVDDPLLNSTSLRVPPVLDWWHHHASHHVEHHIFPKMSTEHYPQVRALLQEHYPERFRTPSAREALKCLWTLDLFLQDAPDWKRPPLSPDESA
jgi:fatty acid desaturase